MALSWSDAAYDTADTSLPSWPMPWPMFAYPVTTPVIFCMAVSQVLFWVVVMSETFTPANVARAYAPGSVVPNVVATASAWVMVLFSSWFSSAWLAVRSATSWVPDTMPRKLPDWTLLRLTVVSLSFWLVATSWAASVLTRLYRDAFWTAFWDACTHRSVASFALDIQTASAVIATTPTVIAATHGLAPMNPRAFPRRLAGPAAVISRSPREPVIVTAAPILVPSAISGWAMLLIAVTARPPHTYRPCMARPAASSGAGIFVIQSTTCAAAPTTARRSSAMWVISAALIRFPKALPSVSMMLPNMARSRCPAARNVWNPDLAEFRSTTIRAPNVSSTPPV